MLTVAQAAKLVKVGMAFTMLHQCLTCEGLTPHATDGVVRPGNASHFQKLECSLCKTSTKVILGRQKKGPEKSVP